MAIKRHVQHIRSSVPESVPTAEQLTYGEIAINYSTDNERMFIKNANNDIVPFYSGKVIEENEQVTAAALTDLDGRINDIEENNVNTENMESVTYSELKSKRNNGELVPGKHYRITDYVTTTTQENTQSAGHQFDIVVLALDEKTLSENAHAMLHDGDTYFSTNRADLSAWELKYYLDNDTNRFAWAVVGEQKELRLYKADGYAEEEGSYPMNEGENHIDRSDWFSYIGTTDYNGSTYYAWRKYEGEGEGVAKDYVILTNTLYQPGDLNPGTNDEYDGSNPGFNGVAADVAYTLIMDGDTTNDYEGLNHNSKAIDEYVCLCEYGEVSGADSVVFETGNGKGVVYYMKDEWNNECHYDFKNIQFNRKLSNGALDATNGDDTFVYTFNLWRINAQKIEDASIIGNTLVNDEEHINGVYGNKINPVSEYNVYSEQTRFEVTQYLLNDNVFLNYEDAEGFFYGCYTNILGYDCSSNTFGNMCCSNNFGDNCHNNTFGGACNSNTLGDNCASNTLGGNCGPNTFGDGCSSNTFGNDCGSNTLGDNCDSNTFGNECGSNTLGDECHYNTFGNGCLLNTLGDECRYNTFGNKCESNTLGDECITNSFGSHVRYSTFGKACLGNSFGNACLSNSFGNRCYNNIFGNNCISNIFVNYCKSNTFGNDCKSNTFGNECSSNSFGNSVNSVRLSIDYTYYVVVESGNHNITLSSTATTSLSNPLRNITIAQGVNNTDTNKEISHNTVNDTFKTTYQSANSVVVNV